MENLSDYSVDQYPSVPLRVFLDFSLFSMLPNRNTGSCGGNAACFFQTFATKVEL